MPQMPAVVYLDTDRSANGVYDYRRPHFEAAAALGWHRITLFDEEHEHRDTIARSCEEVVLLPGVTKETVVDAVTKLKARYDVKLLFGYPGQTVPGIDLPRILEEACQALGLKHVPADAIKNCNNKFIMRKALDAAGLPNLRAELIQDETDIEAAAERIGFPLIFKPIFGAGSALISKCDNLDALKAHYRLFRDVYAHTPSAVHYGGSEHRFRTADGVEHDYVPGTTAMIETYLDGVEATIECIVHDGEPTPLLLHEKLLVTHEASTVLEHLLIVPSVSFTEKQIADAMAYCRDCVAALKLDCSLVHFEFRMTASGPRVIEINPRVGGFYVHRSLQDLAGLDPFLANLAMLSGEFDPWSIVRARRTAALSGTGYHTMFVIYPPRSGKLAAIDGALLAAQRQGVREFRVTSHRGDVQRDTEEEYIAKFWAAAPTQEAVMQLYHDVQADLLIDIHSKAS